MQTRVSFSHTNKSQQYATHGFFRYFGKLPPVATRHILEKCAVEGELIVDLMSGSGTTLVEAQLLGYEAVGVEVNPLSVLISRVKTTPIDVKKILKTLDQLLTDVRRDVDVIDRLKPFESKLGYLANERPDFFNRNFWFEEYIEASLIALKHHIKSIEDEKLRDFFMVAFLSIIRKVSNASVRTGRIFKEAEPSKEDVVLNFIKKVKLMAGGMDDYNTLVKNKKTKIITGDARKSPLKDNSAGFVINHPPYFALYKYSSDVLRFELEWGGFRRKEISKEEIRDGFKTTKISDFDFYLEDMTDVFREAYRILRPQRKFCIVVNDSTLREEQLPVIDSFITVCKEIGFRHSAHEIRDVIGTQAQYHRSANPNIITKEDHLLYFEK
jgi:site-specific DNA-methyltransferase (cytosine-N4-specific)